MSPHGTGTAEEQGQVGDPVPGHISVGFFPELNGFQLRYRVDVLMHCPPHAGAEHSGSGRSAVGIQPDDVQHVYAYWAINEWCADDLPWHPLPGADGNLDGEMTRLDGSENWVNPKQASHGNLAAGNETVNDNINAGDIVAKGGTPAQYFGQANNSKYLWLKFEIHTGGDVRTFYRGVPAIRPQ